MKPWREKYTAMDAPAMTGFLRAGRAPVGNESESSPPPPRQAPSLSLTYLLTRRLPSIRELRDRGVASGARQECGWRVAGGINGDPLARRALTGSLCPPKAPYVQLPPGTRLPAQQHELPELNDTHGSEPLFPLNVTGTISNPHHPRHHRLHHPSPRRRSRSPRPSTRIVTAMHAIAKLGGSAGSLLLFCDQGRGVGIIRRSHYCIALPRYHDRLRPDTAPRPCAAIHLAIAGGGGLCRSYWAPERGRWFPALYLRGGQRIDVPVAAQAPAASLSTYR